MISSYLAGEMGRPLRKQVEQAAVQSAPALRDEELDLLHLLERRLKAAA